MKTDSKTSRRQWLNGLLRGGLLAAFGTASYHLVRRKPDAEGDCLDPDGHVGCRACMELNRCGLPKALSVKQFLSNNGQEKQKS